MKPMAEQHACTDTFLFTRKKFMGLREHTRHRHVLNWLTSIYQKLMTSRVSEKALTLIYANYAMISDWLDIQCPPMPDNRDDMRSWVEFISNAAHFHRIQAGMVPKDHHLLEKVTFQDHAGPRFPGNPMTDYHIALDGLRSLFNVGSIIRTCDAAGFVSVILGNTPGDDHPAVRKTAMGAHQWVTQTRTADLAASLTDCKNYGFPVIGIETMTGSRPFSEFDWPSKGIIVFGNEEYGISASVLKTCDAFVHIPVFGRKNSINVAAAVSVIAFHVACRSK
jgi:tRNA G18 (ribose-2'-O)-methylase SpoU